MNLILKPLTKSAFNYFLRFSIDDYGHDLFRYHEVMDPDRAMKVGADEIMPLVPQGVNTKNQFMYRVKDGDITVGWLWYQLVDDGKTCFLLYIYTEKEHRGKGYGKAILKLYEDMAKKHGAQDLIFFVFQKNTPAVNLYKKTGYTILKESGFYEAKEHTRYKMFKKVK